MKLSMFLARETDKTGGGTDGSNELGEVSCKCLQLGILCVCGPV